MSEDGFHAHGPHDHAVEHAAEGAHGGNDKFAGNIAVMTAILATAGAMFGYMGGATQSDAGLYKNNAVIAKTAAANQWDYYQAKGTKENLAELGMLLPGADPAKFKGKMAHYEEQKVDIMKEAQKFEAESTGWNHKSDIAMHRHHQWALATTVEQIAISLAAISLLTRRRWLLVTTYVVAVAGLVLGACAWVHVDPLGELLIKLGLAVAEH